MKTIYKYLILFVLSVLVSCQEELNDFSLTEGDIVSVSMDMKLHDLDMGTKAVIDPDIDAGTPVKNVIHNFWILQFDGTSDNSKMIAEPRYHASYDKFMDSAENGGHGGKVELISSNAPNTIFILANTFNPLYVFRKGITLAEIKDMKQMVTDDTCFLAKDPTGDRYPILSALWTGNVTPNQPITCRLMRNVARLDIKIINSSSDITIKSWQIKSVPGISYLTTSYELPDVFPSMANFSLIDYPIQQPSSPIVPVEGSSTSITYRTYVPVNQRGKVSNIDGEEHKNMHAPQNSTYLVINASYGDGIPLSYTFYLGADLHSDFNLKPNHSYSYVFDIQGKGDAATDSRVKELGLVNFADGSYDLANCYMINPGTDEDFRRAFRIPVKRVDDFWDGYENFSNNMLGTSGKWRVELIAYNFNNDDNKISLTKSTGKGIRDKDGNLEYFEVSVKANTIGNAIVAIYHEDQPVTSGALWSWHLWITGYSPDEAINRIPEDGVYEYPVSGGVVHRYEGTAWKTGRYARSFIMDRNLGASDTEYHGSGKNPGHGVMYYQFGRKDPMFGIQPLFGEFGKTEVTETTISSSVRYSVMYPLNIMYPGKRQAWTKGNKYNPVPYDSKILWNDPETAPTGKNPGGKSIFDPCPPGYCLPQTDLWSDFRKNIDSKPTTNARDGGNMVRGFWGYSQTKNLGLYYWPYVEPHIDKLPENLVYYPSSGYKDSSQGVSSLADYLYSLTSNPGSVDGSNAFVHRKSGASLGTESFPRNLAFPVRCVSYSKQN